MEVQLTDFENAAFVVFVALLTRTIRSFNMNFYIPITKVLCKQGKVLSGFEDSASLQVDENMRRAHHRGAALNERFYFRKIIHKGTHRP